MDEGSGGQPVLPPTGDPIDQPQPVYGAPVMPPEDGAGGANGAGDDALPSAAGGGNADDMGPSVQPLYGAPPIAPEED